MGYSFAAELGHRQLAVWLPLPVLLGNNPYRGQLRAGIPARPATIRRATPHLILAGPQPLM